MPRRNPRQAIRLKARIEDWNNIPNKETNLRAQGLQMNKPGSQNRKK